MAIIIVILVIYMAGMLAIGFAGKKKSETMTDFLTAGKSGGMFVMVCTYIGAHVGNGIVVGGAQYGAEYGIGGVWFGLGACLSYVLFALVMSRLLYTRGYITIPDLIRDRYKSKFASVLMAVLNICATLGIMAAQIMAGCALFEALGLNPTLGGVLMAVVVFIYCSISGMWGVMMTDSVQTMVIFFSTIFCIVTIAMHGGFDTISAALPESSFDFVPFTGERLVMMMVPGALNGLISGAAYQRTASCKDKKVAFWSPMIAAVALIPFVVMPVIIGMYGKALFPDAPTASILFKVVLSDMNPIVAGLMIAAVLSAVMSTMDIGLLNVTANAVNDIYYKTLNPNADEKKLGRLSMIVTIASGVIALVLAISSSSILSLLSSTYSLMNAGALVMVLGGIFWKKGTKEGAIASALCGMAMIILNKCGVEIPYIAFTSLVPALIAYIVVSLVTQPKGIKAE